MTLLYCHLAMVWYIEAEASLIVSLQAISCIEIHCLVRSFDPQHSLANFALVGHSGRRSGVFLLKQARGSLSGSTDLQELH